MHNYWSRNDWVLACLDKFAQAGESAVGNVGFRTKFPTVNDHDVSRKVPGHSAYFDNIDLL